MPLNRQTDLLGPRQTEIASQPEGRPACQQFRKSTRFPPALRKPRPICCLRGTAAANNQVAIPEASAHGLLEATSAEERRAEWPCNSQSDSRPVIRDNLQHGEADRQAMAARSRRKFGVPDLIKIADVKTVITLLMAVRVNRQATSPWPGRYQDSMEGPPGQHRHHNQSKQQGRAAWEGSLQSNAPSSGKHPQSAKRTTATALDMR